MKYLNLLFIVLISFLAKISYAEFGENSCSTQAQSICPNGIASMSGDRCTFICKGSSTEYTWGQNENGDMELYEESEGSTAKDGSKGGLTTGGDAKVEGAAGSNQACTKQIPITQKYCKTLEWMNESMAGQISNGLLSAFAAAKSAGNTKAACESAKKISAISTGVNAASAALCQKSVITCKAECSKNTADASNLETCNQY